MRLVFSIIMLLVSIPAFAQDPVVDRRIEEMRVKELKKTEVRKLLEPNPFVWDYGGVLNYRYDHYKNQDNNADARDALDYTHTADLRLWFKAVYKPSNSENAYGAYLRFKDQLTIMKEPADLNKSFDNRGPLLDLGYLSFTRKSFSAEAGRRFFQLGSGIALSNTADGGEFTVTLDKLALKTLAAHNLPHESNIDFSVPGAAKDSDRIFLGAQATYNLLPKSDVYVYSLVQRDQSDENPADLTHDYGFDSNYFGVGLEGEVIPRSRYWVETIFETGQSRVYSTAEKSDIRAHAVDAGVSYTVNVYSRPRLSLEYAFGSGDEDRFSVTDTFGGNTSGDDKNFLYLGFLNTGYALAPLLSNMQFYRAGSMFTPFENNRALKNFDVGIDYYRFYKDEKAGAIYDLDASNAGERYVGQEIDLTFTYKIFSDLSTTLEYGYFVPGDAYSDSANDSAEYLSLNVRLSF